MRSRRPFLLLLGLGLTACLALPACSRPAGPPTALAVVAPADLADLADALTTDFNQQQQAVEASASRAEPRQLLAALQRDPTAVVISYTLGASMPVSAATFALDAIAVGVPYTNPVESLTAGQVREIFAGRTVSWTEVGGRNVAVQPFSREEGAVVRQVLEAWALGSGASATNKVTRNALMVSSDAGMVAALEAEPGGVGYALLRRLSQRVRPLRLNGVAPSAAAIQQGQYPLVLRLSALTASSPTGPAAELVAYLRGRAGQQVLQSRGLVAAR